MLADQLFKKKRWFFYRCRMSPTFLNNNTFRLYKRGWTGINIDLDYNTIEMFNFLEKKI